MSAKTALAITQRGTLLAFCEARRDNRGDWGEIDILLRRSTDRGASWSNVKKVAQVAGPHAKNPVSLAQKLAKPDTLTYNNPLVIADRAGTIHLLFCLEYARAFYCASTGDGENFSAPVESQHVWKERL